jgi:putative glutamine amidotransferase
VSSARSAAEDEFGPVPANWVSDAMLTAVRMAGGAPVAIPVGPAADEAASLVAAADALVLSGGDDVGLPGASFRADRVDAVRDETERQLVELARGYGLPILGVCRGMHVLAVMGGGTLEEVAGHATYASGPSRSHPVELVAASRLRRALDVGRFTANSFHHFAVVAVGDNRVVARAADGVVEAIEHPERWEIGVQWHPELPPGRVHSRLWRALVDQAAQHRIPRHLKHSKT